MTQRASPSSDPLSEVLESFAARSTIFCRSELRAPWAFRVDGEAVAKFHLILEGEALLLCDSTVLDLGPGDVVVLPRGTEHTLADHASSPARPLARLLAEHDTDDGSTLRYGGSGALTRLLCGGVAFTEGVSEASLALFPNVIHARPEPSSTRWLPLVLDDLRAEAGSGRPGASAVVARIADVFLVQALRGWLLGRGLGPGDGRVIRDEAIARGVEMLTAHPSEAWSVARLSKHVGLSRTALTAKFREQVGHPPMRYLQDVRLRRAADSIATGRLSLDEIAHRAGYGSSASFAKAFKRRFGMTPATFRAKAAGPPQVEVAAVG